MSEYFPGYKEMHCFDSNRNREIYFCAWYPTSEKPSEVTYLAHFKSKASAEARIEPGPWPIVFISHGSRGHRYNQWYLAEHLARSGYVVFSIEHTHDTAFDDTFSDFPENHYHRVVDILCIFDQLKKSIFFNDNVDKKKIIFIGHSFGAFTSFILAGGRADCFDEALYLKVKKTFNNKVIALVLLAPALFEKINNKKKISTPTLLMTAGKDELLFGLDNQYATLFSTKEHLILSNTGHYVFIMECPEPVAVQCPEVCIDFGIPRSEIHPIIKNKITSFIQANIDYGGS